MAYNLKFLVGFLPLFCGIFFGFLLTNPSVGMTQTSKEKFTYKIIPSIENTWGYAIYQDGKLFIHQPHIPSVTGNRGFHTAKAAEKVAKAVIQKLNRGIMPPSITYQELQKLHALPK